MSSTRVPPGQHIHHPHSHQLAIQPVLLVEAAVAAGGRACCYHASLVLLLLVPCCLLCSCCCCCWLLWWLWWHVYQGCVHKKTLVVVGCELIQGLMVLLGLSGG